MKHLADLPVLPARHYWSVQASSTSNQLTVGMYGPREESHIPRLLGWDLTRSWPAPNSRNVVKTARRVYRQWQREQARAGSHLVGNFVGGTQLP